jgi:hypothetical protein
MSTPASTLSVYDGRLRLGTIEVRYIKGCAEYRATLANGRALGRFAKQADATAAINAAVAEVGRQVGADASSIQDGGGG